MEFMAPGKDTHHLSFLVEGTESAKPPAQETDTESTSNPADQTVARKRKPTKLPSLDLEAIQPSISKKAKTGAKSKMETDSTLTLVDLAAEPVIVPAAEVKKGELKNAVVTNGGYALTQLVSGAPLKPVYSLAPEEYKENRWEGVYAKERRRFVLIAQQLHGTGSVASDEEKAEGERKWQEHPGFTAS